MDKKINYDSLAKKNLFAVKETSILDKVIFSFDKVDEFLEYNLNKKDKKYDLFIYDEFESDIHYSTNVKTKMLREIVNNDNINKVTIYVNDELLKRYVTLFSILKIPKDKQNKFLFIVTFNKNVVENDVSHISNLENFYSPIFLNKDSKNYEDLFVWYDVKTLANLEKNMVFDSNIVKSTIDNFELVKKFYKFVEDNYDITKLNEFDIVYLAYKYIKKNTNYKMFLNKDNELFENQSKLLTILLSNPFSNFKSFCIYGKRDDELHCWNGVVINGKLYQNYMLDGLFESSTECVPFSSNKLCELYEIASLTREQVLSIEEKLKECKKKTNRLVK